MKDVCKLGPGPLLDEINKDIKGVVAGIRAQPFNIPGTANHHALQVNLMCYSFHVVDLFDAATDTMIFRGLFGKL